jgi:lactoylglutathione lyase
MTKKACTIALMHIGITVSDLDVSEGFYQEVLGLRVVDESLGFPSRSASMARDGKAMLTLWEHSHDRLKKIKKGQPGLHHLAFEVGSVEEVNRTKGLLDNLGAQWTEGARIYPEGARAAAIHFEDPDGIPIELYSSDELAASDGREMSELELRACNPANPAYPLEPHMLWKHRAPRQRGLRQNRGRTWPKWTTVTNPGYEGS